MQSEAGTRIAAPDPDAAWHLDLSSFQTGGRSNMLLVLAMLVATPVIAGCAQIRSFNVSPGTMCPGEKVNIDWKASGDVVLTTVPSTQGEGAGSAEGTRSFTPKESTRFVLKVPGLLRDAQREWDVEVIPGQSERLLGGIAECGGSPAFVSTSFTLAPEDISARVRAVSVENGYRRALLVNKGGREVEIFPNSATDRFKDMPVAGAWTLRAPVGDGENCDGALDAVRGRLTIRTQMSCGEGPDGAP